MLNDKLSPFRSVPELVVKTDDGEKTDFSGVSAKVLGRVASLVDITKDEQLFQDAEKTILVSFMLDTLINGPDTDDINPEIETYAPSVVVYDSLGPVLLNPEFCRTLGTDVETIRKKIEDGTYMDWAYDAENADKANTLVAILKAGHGYGNQQLNYRNGIKNRWTSFGLPENSGSIRFAESGRHGFLTTLELGLGDDIDAHAFVKRIHARILEILPPNEEDLRHQANALVPLLDLFNRAWLETPFAMNLWLPKSDSKKSLNNPGYVAVTGYSYEDVQKWANDGTLVKKLYFGAARADVDDAVDALNEGEIDAYFKSFRIRRKDGTNLELGWLRRRFSNTVLSEHVRECSNGKLEKISQAIGGASFGVATIAKTGEQQSWEDLAKDIHIDPEIHFAR